LRQIDLLEPLDCDMVVRPAVVGRDIIPVGDVSDLVYKPLLLNSLPLKIIPGFRRRPSAVTVSIKVIQVRDCEPLRKAFLLGSLLPMTKESKPSFLVD
jgi:hypothetical protein